MDIQKALKMAKELKIAVTSGGTTPWMAVPAILAVYNGEVITGDEVAEFMKLLLSTFLDVHDSLSKTLEKNEELRDAYNKYGEPFVHALQKSQEEHSHNFVQQWEKQHRDCPEEDVHLINFGPTDQELETDDPEESEEDIPQIVINIRELNINLNGGI